MANVIRKIKAYRGWIIRPRDNGSWQIDNCRHDKAERVRMVQPNLEAAQAEIDRRITRLENYGLKGDGLSDKARVEAAEALATLEGNASILEAVRFWKQHHPTDGENKTLREMATAWLSYLVKKNRRARTVKQCKHRIEVFVSTMGEEVPVASITRKAALDFVASREGCEQTKIGWRAVLHAFFQFCMGNDEAIPPLPQVISINPLARMRNKRDQKETHDEKAPAIMDPAAIQHFMHKCEELHPEDCAAFAILFFAGLRPSELGGEYRMEAEEVTKAKDILAPFTAALKMARLKKRMAVGSKEWHRAEQERIAAEKARLPFLKALKEARMIAASQAKKSAEMQKDRLTWDDVDLQSRTITVRSETSKMRSSRPVDISDNLLLWLTKYRKPNGYVASPPPTLKRHRRNIMAALGMKAWPPDVTRHSFASYYLAEHENIAKTQVQMGHTTVDADVLFTRYRKLVSKQKAKAFWAIRPKTYTEGTRDAHIRIA